MALAWAKAIGATRAGVIETTFREETESLNWRDSRLAEIPLIHLSDGSASTGIACTEAEAGLLPRYPTVVVGQQYLLDPTRVPAGAAALWLQLQEVPYAPRGDAAGELDTAHGWTKALVSGSSTPTCARRLPDFRAEIHWQLADGDRVTTYKPITVRTMAHSSELLRRIAKFISNPLT